jgi:GrpB-like predicted nucleotidyltransferase (UPF0157 family)
VTRVTIVEPTGRWAAEYARIENDLRWSVGERACEIDHIGSTSVLGLPSKDVIDVQITVPEGSGLEDVASLLEQAGWQRKGSIERDHHVPGFPIDDGEWRKVLVTEPNGARPTNVHVRVQGKANQRYALLFRDFLRTHDEEAAAYAAAKRALAALAPDSGTYASAKDPICDLVYLAAERWADDVGWPSIGPDGN